MFIVVLSVTAPELDHIMIGGVRLQVVLVFSIVFYSKPPGDKYRRLSDFGQISYIRRLQGNIIKFYLLWQHSLGDDLTCNPVI